MDPPLVLLRRGSGVESGEEEEAGVVGDDGGDDGDVDIEEYIARRVHERDNKNRLYICTWALW